MAGRELHGADLRRGLTSEPDREKYTALCKLRRGRPLDGIVRVMPQSLNLTPQVSDNDLRGLEKSASCCVILPRSGYGSYATATGRRQNALSRLSGHAFRCVQKKTILPASLKGYCRNCGHRVLVRSLRTMVTTSCCARQHLKDGGIARWAQQLVPWLSASQPRIPLRGLMFSLPGSQSPENAVAYADAEKYVSNQSAMC